MARRLTEEERRRRLFKVAWLRYKKNMKKASIAREIDTSITHVTRLLDEAERKGIVQFKFTPPKLEALGVDLQQCFPCVKEAIVVASTEDYWFQRQLWGTAAAQYFEENVTPGTVVGITGGYTINEMIAALPEREREIEIYPTAIIGRGPTIEHIDPIVLVTQLWVKSGTSRSVAHYATILPFEEDTSYEEVLKKRQEFLENEKIKELYDGMHKRVKIIFTSIGLVGADPEYKKYSKLTTLKLLAEIKGVTEKKLVNELRKDGVVGDLAYAFFDKEGKPSRKWNYFLTTEIERVREMANNYPDEKVVMMAGKFKIEGLKAALKGNLCNVLITDETSARQLIVETQATRTRRS